MTVKELIQVLQAMPEYADVLVHVPNEDGSDGDFSDIAIELGDDWAEERRALVAIELI